MPRLKRTHLFGDALAFGVDADRIEWVRSTEIIFWDVRQAGRLFAIHSARTGEKKLAGRGGPGKAKHALSAVDDRSEHLEGLFGGLSRAGLGSGVDDVVEVTLRKREAANIPRKKSQGRISGKMRALHRKGRRVAREHRGANVEIELAIDVGKAFQQPAPEKAGTPRNEDALVSHLLPERSRFVEDMVKIGRVQRLLCHRLDPLF